MELQVAYNTLDKFIACHGGGLAETEALKTLVAHAKCIQTKARKAGRSENHDGTIPFPVHPNAKQKKPRVTQPNPAPAENTTGAAIGKLWTEEEENVLITEFFSGYTASRMAQLHERTIEAIAARLVKTGCIEIREDLPGYIDYRKALAKVRGTTFVPRSR